MKKVIKWTMIIFLIILVKCIYTFTINAIIVGNYNKNIYNSSLIKSLYFFNFYQPYIVYYNEGNILYRTEKYEEAIKDYEKALKKNPPKSKVCDIRINLALSLVKQVDINDTDAAYSKLEEAKNNLYNDNCASKADDSGRSKDAEKLEEEIKELQEQLGDSSNNGSSDDDNKQEEDENNGEDSSIEEQLKENGKEANSSRQEDLDYYESMANGSYYSGKKW